MKLLDLFAKQKTAKIFQANTYKYKGPRLVRIWRKFIRQIPREFRSVTKSHQHFILIGNKKSGKSELVQGVVEQGQNVYPFEVEYSKEEDIQFYLGPRQIIQEISLDVVKDRTIKLRRLIIRLWKKLFVKGPPIVVISYNCWLDSAMDIREANKSARTIGGKLSLLSELTKGPLKIRMVLTHLDKMDGYLEFARFLKQHNIAFDIPLTSNFKYEVLLDSLSEFRDEYLSLILTTTSTSDYTKILKFFSELPKLFPIIEEFLRVITTEHTLNRISLETLHFSSHLEPYTSFGSLDWTPENTSSIFYRHPMLKHQIGAGAIFLILSALVFGKLIQDREQLMIAKAGNQTMDFAYKNLFNDYLINEIKPINHSPFQENSFRFLPRFINRTFPSAEEMSKASYHNQDEQLNNNFRSITKNYSILPRFYQKKLKHIHQTLSENIRKNFLEEQLRIITHEKTPEIKIIYMLGLMYATNGNNLGKLVLMHLDQWSQMTGLSKQMIKTYILSCSELSQAPINIQHLYNNVNQTPLSSIKPWMEFLNEFKGILDEKNLNANVFEPLREKSEFLLNQFAFVKNDLCALTIAEYLQKISTNDIGNFQDNIETIKWLDAAKKNNLEALLKEINKRCYEIPNVKNLNLNQLFVKLEKFHKLQEEKINSISISLNDQSFDFSIEDWCHISTSYVMGKLIQNYIIATRESNGEIFFKNTLEFPELIVSSYRNEFPHFSNQIIIPGRFTRQAYEENVRDTVESLLSKLNNFNISSENKNRFEKFVKEQVEIYCREYQENYERLYHSWEVRDRNLLEIKEILGNISKPSSSFKLFLQGIEHNTDIFSQDDTEFLNTRDNAMNHFSFLSNFLKEDKEKHSSFTDYSVLIKEIHSSINADIQQDVGVDLLENHLTPTASISMSILRNDLSSYQNQIEEILTNNNIPFNYQKIFMAPLDHVHTIGLKKLEEGIDNFWKESAKPQLAILLEKFPFNPKGTELVTFKELERFTSPKGKFYEILSNILTPVCKEINGRWSPIKEKGLLLSEDIYSAFNQLHKVSKRLWDSEGNPKHLVLKIRPVPFEKKEQISPAPSAAYFIHAKEKISNINQKPSWKDINIEWWGKNTSTVTMKFENKNGSGFYLNNGEDETYWSFYKHLSNADTVENNIWHWIIRDYDDNDLNSIAFEFDSNPWDIFQPHK